MIQNRRSTRIYAVRWITVIAINCAASLASFGALWWESRQISLTTSPTDKQAIALFRFKNSGTTPVKIISTKPSCACTVAAPSKETYEAGESGEIKATFTVGDRTGVQEKTILVTTDAEPAKPTILTLRVSIPETFSFAPRLLLWRTTDGGAGKTVLVTNNGTQKLVAIEMKGEAALAKVKIEELEVGKRYRIVVQPTSIANTGNTPLSFVAKFSDNSTRPFVIYALVK